MKKLLLICASVLILATAACAPAEPTVDPAQIQASAVAAASTMVAMTQAAIPTATEIPPTPLPTATPLPSPTLIALPTLPLGAPTTGPAFAPTNANTACEGPMAADPDGPKAVVRILNQTNGSVVLSLYLQKTLFGECGYVSANIEPHGSLSKTIPQGCYFAGAFVSDPKKQTKAFGNGCVNADKGTVTVGTEVITISN